MTTLFILSYVIPLIIVFILCYRDKDIVTVRDLLNWSWTYLIPVINIYVIFVYVITFIVNNMIKTKINTDLWNNFLDRKL